MGRLFPEVRRAPQDDNQSETPPREALPSVTEQGDTEVRIRALELELMFQAMSGDPTALETLRQLADQGDAAARVALGNLYANVQGVFDGVRKDEAEAARWYRMAAQQGNAMAQFFRASRRMRLKPSAGTGWPLSGRRWSAVLPRYASGDLGVQQDEAEAARWIRTAAQQGCSRACTPTAKNRRPSRTTPKRPTGSGRPPRRATEAQVELGGMYAHGGLGVQQNDAEAARWIRTAAARGYAEAQIDLAFRYASACRAPRTPGQNQRAGLFVPVVARPSYRKPGRPIFGLLCRT